MHHERISASALSFYARAKECFIAVQLSGEAILGGR
jgi:hypothetical protein